MSFSYRSTKKALPNTAYLYSEQANPLTGIHQRFDPVTSAWEPGIVTTMARGQSYNIGIGIGKERIVFMRQLKAQSH